MISNSGMRNAHNDNELFSFHTIGSAVTKLIERITSKRDEQQNENREDYRPRKQTPEERARDQREYIKRRLREIEAFERRARGDRGPTKRPL